MAYASVPHPHQPVDTLPSTRWEHDDDILGFTAELCGFELVVVVDSWEALDGARTVTAGFAPTPEAARAAAERAARMAALHVVD